MIAQSDCGVHAIPVVLLITDRVSQRHKAYPSFGSLATVHYPKRRSDTRIWLWRTREEAMMPEYVAITIKIPRRTWGIIQRSTAELQGRAREQGMLLEQAVDMQETQQKRY